MTNSIKTNFGYVVMTLSLGLMLTACGGDDKNSSGAHMQVQEGGRPVISDNDQNNFVACGGGSDGNGQNGQRYQYDTGGEIRIEYVQRNGNQGYSNNTYNNNNNSGYDNGSNEWSTYNGGVHTNNGPDGNGQPYSNQPYANQSYGNGARVSISIGSDRGQNSYANPQNNNNNNFNNQSGYVLNALRISEIQNQVGAECQLTNFNDSSSTISGSITCPSNYQGSGIISVNFSCQRR